MAREKTYDYAEGSHYEGLSPSEIFQSIYQNRVWTDAESVSGPGSSLAQTHEIREQLPRILKVYGIKSMLDIPCGDFNWMQHTDLGDCLYTGADIVPELVQANQDRFGGAARRFIHHDLIQQVPGAFDLVFCRDCLVHFSFKDIFASLKNLQASKSAYLMTTTFTGQEVNTDIPTGGWRPLNFSQAPFHFPMPVVIFEEKCTEGDGLFRDKSLAMWRLSDLNLPDLL